MNVYIISNEQPFENWFGTLKSCDFLTGKCVVENNEEEEIELYMSEVRFLILLPILNFVHYNSFYCHQYDLLVAYFVD